MPFGTPCWRFCRDDRNDSDAGARHGPPAPAGRWAVDTHAALRGPRPDPAARLVPERLRGCPPDLLALPDRAREARLAHARQEIMKKVIVIGLDGFEPTLVEPLLAAGALPNLGRLPAQGGDGGRATTAPCERKAGVAHS